MGHERIVTVLMGPTASGKSALALEVAKKRPVVIINADAMQMYDGLRILTARPSEADLAQAEHAMYGVWPATTRGTAQMWAEQVKFVIEKAWVEGKRPLLVGGTGLYVRALAEGFSPIPSIEEHVREGVRALERESGTQGVREALEKEDSIMAGRLKAGDTQRNMRALEVIRGTGKSLALWQEEKGEPLLEADYRYYALRPERETVYAAIDRRVLGMLEEGVLEEVKALTDRNISEELPSVKAIGVEEFQALLEGRMGRDEAIGQVQQKSRNYAKRQMTWIRQQLPFAKPGEAIFTEA